jgi:hypothetical protein
MNYQYQHDAMRLSGYDILGLNRMLTDMLTFMEQIGMGAAVA